ncbi:MAG: MaoC family dehydratase N-terminal domain-containing protein [Gammaproteobacteria bacterium]|nr:MaoC family dehydratase N-terminal domain-containing protein [Gammaproteobacteria bacterium]
MSSLLTADLLANIGRSAPPKKELVTRRDIRKYSIATGQRIQKYLAGDEAPPMFHIALFWDVVELDQLTPDGISIDALVPKFPLERAMAGGLKIEYHQPILAGDMLVATRTLTDIYEKQGSQGPLIFYEVVMQVETEAGEKVLTETATRILR